MRRRGTWSLVAAFFLPNAAVAAHLQEPSPTPLHVVSYNIRYNTPADGENAWPKRKNRVAKLVLRLRPDLCGFQEALIGQVRDLEERLSDYDWVGVGREDGWKKGELTPIFYRRDRLELLQTDTFWLSENPEQPGSKSWDAALPRIATWARFRDRRNNNTFYFFNTHFDHRGAEARRQSVHLLLRKTASITSKEPFILAGDFNFDERSRPYMVITAPSSGLRDARYGSRTPHQGPTASFNDWRALRAPETRIDYLFVSEGIDVLSHRIVDTRSSGRFPSDHLPVGAAIEIRKRPEAQ